MTQNAIDRAIRILASLRRYLKSAVAGTVIDADGLTALGRQVNAISQKVECGRGHRLQVIELDLSGTFDNEGRDNTGKVHRELCCPTCEGSTAQGVQRRQMGRSYTT